MATSSDLAWALSQLDPNSGRQRLYSTYRAYYDGDHRLAFATRTYKSAFWEIFREFADNLCSSVVDVQAERLEIVGFTTSQATVDTTGTVPQIDDPFADSIWDVWEDGYLPIASDQVHHDVLNFGDAFAILDEDDENGGICFYHQDPESMAVRYDKVRRGTLNCAAKEWLDNDNYQHVDLFFVDRTEQWISKTKITDPTKTAKDVFGFVSNSPTSPSDYDLYKVIDHRLGFVPVYHWANKRYGGYGISELRDVVPIQNALNKQICDMLVAMEFQAFRQRWMTGVEIELDDDGKPKEFPFDYGADRFLALPDENAKVGEFGQADLTPFYMAIRDSRSEIARVSGIPLHYFYVASSDSPSGEALKTTELRFSKKLENRQRLFGKTWEAAMLGMLQYDDATLDYDGVKVPTDTDFDINAVWHPTNAYSPSEQADFLLKKKALGVPLSQLQKELGYDPDEVARFADEADAIKANQVVTPPNTAPAEATGTIVDKKV